MLDVGHRARAASRELARAGTREKNHALEAAAQAILDSGDALRAANREDLERAHERRLAPALLDRLELTPARVAAMAEGLREIAALPDPVGEVSELRYRPSGIQVGRMRVPLGVIGIVYESRPNVTADAAGLCLKAGNATILRGGSEAIRSNLAIARCIDQGLEEAGLPADAVHVGRDRGPRCGRVSDPHGRVRRHHRAEGRKEPHRAYLAGGDDPGDQAPRRRVPRLYRRSRRPRQGAGDRLQREGATLRHLQHDGNSAGRTRSRGRSPAPARRPIRSGAGRVARMSGIPTPGARLPSGERGGLGHRVPRPHPVGAGGLRSGRGAGPHRRARLAAHRRHRHRGSSREPGASSAKSIRAR